MNRKNFARSTIAAAVLATFVGAYAHFENSGMSHANAANLPLVATVAQPPA